MTHLSRHKIDLPWRIPYGKKDKYFYVNLNQYRNTHFHILNGAKRTFEEIVSKSVLALPKIEQADLTYLIFPHRNTKLDVSNVCSIADKFFSDLLTLHKVIPDDNYDHISNVHYSYGGKSDRGYSYIEVIIDIIKLQEDEAVRMLFTSADIKSMMTAHVAATLREGTQFRIELSGEGDDIEASVIVEGTGAPVEPETKAEPAKRATRTRKPAEQPVKEKEDPAPATEPEQPENPEEDEDDDNPPFDTGESEGEDAGDTPDGPEEQEKADPDADKPKKGGLFAHLKNK